MAAEGSSQFALDEKAFEATGQPIPAARARLIVVGQGIFPLFLYNILLFLVLSRYLAHKYR